MDDSLKVYWELYFDRFSVEEILRSCNNPIRGYENEMIDGAIIDIGCGQSSLLLDYLHTNREIIAVDNEHTQLDYLKRRVESQEKSTIGNWTFLNATFPQDNLPKKVYSLIILSNLLHFFSLDQSIEIGVKISGMCQPGTLIYVGVHSTKYYANKPEDPNNNAYFKHYFSSEDLDKVFPQAEFNRIYNSEIQMTESKEDRDHIEKWIEKLCDLGGVIDPMQVEFEKNRYMENLTSAEIVSIYVKI